MSIVETIHMGALYQDTLRALRYNIEPVERVKRRLKKLEEEERFEECALVYKALNTYLETF